MKKVYFIGGWGSEPAIWTPFLKDFENTFRCETLDWQDYLEKGSLFKTLEQEQAPFVLVGWSLGSLMSLGAAAKGLPGLKGLVLISPTAKMTGEENYPGADAKVLDQMIEGIESKTETVLTGFGRLCFFPSRDRGRMKKYVKTALSIDKKVLKQGLEYLRDGDERNTISAITVPVYCIHGEKDQVIPWENGEFVSQKVGKGSFDRIPRQGHGITFDSEKELIERTRDFIDASFNE